MKKPGGIRFAQYSGVTNAERQQRLERTMARYGYSSDALIEVLHTAQSLYGYLSQEILETIAERLKMPPSRVLGVATFYHLFSFEPKAPHQAVVCLGTACYAAGGKKLENTLRKNWPNWQLKVGRCLSSCGLAPIVVCDGEARVRLTPERLEAQLKELSE
jgi:bidirectional [NiFe] hydrogenase diaphorase subunit